MSFCFPTNLSTEEIIQCLQDLQIHLDVGQLAKPTYEQIKLCYEQAVLALTGVSREELTQPKFGLLSTFEHPELHDESVPVKNFFSQITKLMLICGVRDFTLNDVYKPEPARLKRNLCALINFAKFRDEKLTMLDDLEAELASQLAEEQALTAEIEASTAEIKQLKEQRAVRQAEVAPIQAETEAMRARVVQLHKVTEVLDKENRVLRTHINQLTDQASEAKLALTSLQNEIAQLEDEIVQSPEKHRQAIAELVSATELQRAYYARLSAQSIDCDRKMEMICKFERELQRCIKLLEELDAAVARKKNVNTAVKDAREAIAHVDLLYSELEASKHTGLRQLGFLQENLSRLEHQNQLKLEVAASMVEEQRKAREAVEAEKAAEEARAAEVEAQVRGWRERAAEVTTAKEARVRAVKEKYTLLRRTVAEYNRKMDELLSTPLPGSAQPLAAGDDGSDVLGADQDRFGLAGSANILTSGVQGLRLV